MDNIIDNILLDKLMTNVCFLFLKKYKKVFYLREKRISQIAIFMYLVDLQHRNKKYTIPSTTASICSTAITTIMFLLSMSPNDP